MTDGDVVTSNRTVAPSLDVGGVGGAIERRMAGHAATVHLLTVQSAVPPRSTFARLIGMSPLSAETNLLYRGVVGEIEVGEALARLGPDWVVLHAVPVDAGEADIDHLVIGPSGVYVIATKNHPGQAVWASERTLMVGGVRHPHIRNMELEMGRAERMLSAGAGTAVEVSGVLAIVAPKSLTIKDRHRDVAVLQSTQLVPWLLRRKRSLSEADIRLITDAAALATTWFQGEETAVEPESLRIRFETLRAAVNRAWHVQVTWAVVASVVAVGGFGALIYSILVTALNSTSN
jgi:hypothetical protein